MSLAMQLLDTNAVGVRREKMYKLDDHICCAVAGLTGETKAPIHHGLEHLFALSCFTTILRRVVLASRSGSHMRIIQQINLAFIAQPLSNKCWCMQLMQTSWSTHAA